MTTIPGIEQCRRVRSPNQCLRIAVELGIKCLEIRGDSELVVDQVIEGSDGD
jgi:ribonuclease HI